MFESQLVEKLFEISQKATTIIDIHSSGYESPFYIYAHRNLLDDARKFWVADIILRDEAWNSFEDQNFILGKKAYTLELGPSRVVTPQQIDTGVKHLLNYLFEGTVTDCTSWNNNQLQSIFSPYAGILVWQKDIGEYFTTGDILAIIYTADGKKNLIADMSGKFLIKNPIHAVFQNQEIWQTLVNKIQ